MACVVRTFGETGGLEPFEVTLTCMPADGDVTPTLIWDQLLAMDVPDDTHWQGWSSEALGFGVNVVTATCQVRPQFEGRYTRATRGDAVVEAAEALESVQSARLAHVRTIGNFEDVGSC